RVLQYFGEVKTTPPPSVGVVEEIRKSHEKEEKTKSI
ncbi:hypothetical protein L916_00393, partial [Phytophthora nicotianae]